MSKEATGDVLEEISGLFRSPTSISILLTGTTGSGRSTLVNGILGRGFAKENEDFWDPCTLEVTEYKRKVGKIDVSVWDTPGLPDGTPDQEKYLCEMVEKCSHVDITMYCFNSNVTRFDSSTHNPDVMAMINFTKAFGTDFWKNAVIVLTFANLVGQRLSRFYPAQTEKAEAFNKKIQEWEKLIAELLKNYAGVPSKIVDSIKIIPAGHPSKHQLPDREYWLSTLWFECLNTIASPEAKEALLNINLGRIKPIVIPSGPSVAGAIGSVVGGALGFLNRKLLGGSIAAGTDPLFDSKFTTEYLCWF